jgi:hypothetical protein
LYRTARTTPLSRAFLVAESERIGASRAARNMGVSRRTVYRWRRRGATCTFHVFLLDRERRLRYRGRFDDSRKADRVTSHDLRNALEDVLAGRNVRVPETEPFGCGLDLT